MQKRIAEVALLVLMLGLAAVSLAQGSGLQYEGPIYSGPELDYQPSIIRVEPSGRLLVVFERLDPSSIMGDFFVAFSDDGGQTWSSPTPALTSARNERHPSLIQLAPGSFVLFYLLCDDHSGANARIHRATSPDGLTWTDQGPLDLGWPTTGELNPNVIRETDGTMTMTYQRSGSGYISQSTDDGVTWDTSQTMVNDSARLPRLAKRESDGLYIVSYQRSIGGSNMGIFAKVSPDPYDWNVAEVPISDVINSHDSQPIVLEDGTFLVVYAKTPVLYFDLFYRTSCDGANWSDEVQVTDDSSHYDTQPHPMLQGTLGHIILTWSHQVSVTPYEDHDVYINTDLVVPPDLSTSSKTVEPALFSPGGLLTYTLFLDNSGAGPTAGWLTDPIPADTTYAGGLWASSGNYGYDPVNEVITWTGDISICGAVTLTFRVSTTSGLGDGDVVTNTARLTDSLDVGYTLAAAATADALPPTSVILDPVEGQLISSTAYLISGVASDTVSGVDTVEVSVDGGPWQPATGQEAWSIAWAGLTDGEHNARSRATDLMGHVEVPGPGITFTVDATPPELLGFSPPDGAQGVPLSATVVLTFSESIVSDTLAYTIVPDPGGWSEVWNGPATVAYLSHNDFAAGQTYSFTVTQARDLARNPITPTVWSFATACEPVAIVAVTTDISGCVVTFGADLAGDAPFVYDWDLGAFGSSTEPTPTVDFVASGTYPYTLTVSNCVTDSDTVTGTVTMECGTVCQEPDGADFAYSPAMPLVQDTVYFSGNVALGTPPFTYTWDFGDGSPLEEGQHVTHTFTATGNYTVTLTVTNACGHAEHADMIQVLLYYRIYLPVVFKGTGG